MGAVVFPAASAGGKTMFRTTLTSGTAYTVPAGVNYLNVTLVGGSGGGAGGQNNANYVSGGPGLGGQVITSTLNATPGGTINYAIGSGGGGNANSSNGTAGGAGGTTTFTGASSAAGGNGGVPQSNTAFSGGAGQSGATASGGSGGSPNASGGSGAAGCIFVEYWA